MIENLTDIQNKIEAKHSGDSKQLDIIFSREKRMLVVAPAGCGKTSTMVSKIAYMLATGQIPNPKKLLALTFSVNAAYKIKKEVIENIPTILQEEENKIDLSSKVYVSNYHGFARRLLKRHGYIIHRNLLQIDTFQTIDDTNIKDLMQQVKGLSFSEAGFLSNFSDAVKNRNAKYLRENIVAYNGMIIEKLLPLNIITFNAIITLSCKLFDDCTAVKSFYHSLFSAILVDEYQDTNILSFWLLDRIICENSAVILLGDPLQRIYGFIGAVSDLFDVSQKHFKLKEFNLNQNYRFKDNDQMLLLDYNLRENAKNPAAPEIKNSAAINFKLLENQTKEGDYIIELATSIIQSSQTCKVAILVKQRGKNIERIIEQFQSKQVDFFFGLFPDEDIKYINFHKDCLFLFIESLRVKGGLTKKSLCVLQDKIEHKYQNEQDPIILSLISLLKIFFNKIFSDFSYLTEEEKIALIKDTFEHNGLKQYIEFIDSRIIISTVHGAKGLEWEYVIIPDMESDSFPNYYGLCNSCNCRQDCNLVVGKPMEGKFLEELSVFYVAVTRAKKEVYFSASKNRIDYKGGEIAAKVSCFLKLPGIALE